MSSNSGIKPVLTYLICYTVPLNDLHHKLIYATRDSSML